MYFSEVSSDVTFSSDELTLEYAGGLLVTKQSISAKSTAVEAVFKDYIARLRSESAIPPIAISCLEETLANGQYSAEKLRVALLTEESI